MPDFERWLAEARRGVNAGGRVFAGAVLAGGESRRMGRDKAQLEIGGVTLAQRQVRVLRTAGARPVFVVRRPGQEKLRVRARHVWDEFAGAGPLAGLQAALRASEADWVAVVAVDMPTIDAAWFVALASQCKPGCGAVARHRDGYEPLAAIYPREALPVVTGRLQRGERAMQALVRQLVRAKRMKVIRIAADERARFENWNRPEREVEFRGCFRGRAGSLDG